MSEQVEITNQSQSTLSLSSLSSHLSSIIIPVSSSSILMAPAGWDYSPESPQREREPADETFLEYSMEKKRDFFYNGLGNFLIW